MGSTPLIIGVTGHRDLTNETALSALTATVALIENLKKDYPQTPIKVMAGMADGADRVVAQAALQCGLTVDAVLPMPMDLYQTDFSEESLADLSDLLARPEVNTTELPLPEGISRQAAEEGGPVRDGLYANLGKCIRQRCHLLIVLWDGRGTELTGGTLDTLKAYLFGDSVGLQVSFADGFGSPGTTTTQAYWIPVTRSGDHDDAQVVAPPASPCFFSANTEEQSIVMHREIDPGLAGDFAQQDDFNAKYDELSANGRLPASWPLEENIADDSNDSSLGLIRTAYAKADAMAIYYQTLSDRLFLIFSFAAGFMGLAFLIYAKISASKLFLLAYLGTFVFGYFAFKWAHKQHWFTRHLMYRLLAEALRTKYFMVRARSGGDFTARDLTKATRLSSFAGFRWISGVFRTLEPTVPNDAEDGGAVDAARSLWVEDQLAYFRKKSHQLAHNHHRVEHIKGFLLLGLFAAGLGLLFFKKTLLAMGIAGVDAKTILVFLMGLLPLWLGIWEIYENKMASKELAWQYRNQYGLFAEANRAMDQAGTVEDKRRALAELATDSLAETYLWTVQRYHREHEPPSAG